MTAAQVSFIVKNPSIEQNCSHLTFYICSDKRRDSWEFQRSEHDVSNQVQRTKNCFFSRKDQLCPQTTHATRYCDPKHIIPPHPQNVQSYCVVEAVSKIKFLILAGQERRNKRTQVRRETTSWSCKWNLPEEFNTAKDTRSKQQWKYYQSCLRQSQFRISSLESEQWTLTERHIAITTNERSFRRMGNI